MAFKVVTTDGTFVDDNKGQGFEKANAETHAKERNARAEELGIKTRYEVVEK